MSFKFIYYYHTWIDKIYKKFKFLQISPNVFHSCDTVRSTFIFSWSVSMKLSWQDYHLYPFIEEVQYWCLSDNLASFFLWNEINYPSLIFYVIDIYPSPPYDVCCCCCMHNFSVSWSFSYIKFMWGIQCAIC